MNLSPFDREDRNTATSATPIHRKPLQVGKDEAAHPAHVRLIGAKAVVPAANAVTNLIQQSLAAPTSKRLHHHFAPRNPYTTVGVP